MQRAMSERAAVSHRLCSPVSRRVWPPSKRVPRPSGLERRALGKTGVKLSIRRPLGGLVLKDVAPEEASRWWGRRMRRAVNTSCAELRQPEERLGPALATLRDKVFSPANRRAPP